MKAKESIAYLSQLGQELTNAGIREPMHVLLIGGASMLLLVDAPRSTNDVDIFWLEDPTFEHTVEALRESIEAVAAKNRLEDDWFNSMIHLLLSDQLLVPEGTFWKRSGPLHIPTAPREYVLALKMLAGREKDLSDCKILLQKSNITTRVQAQRLLDRSIPPLTQATYAQEMRRSLEEFFGDAP